MTWTDLFRRHSSSGKADRSSGVGSMSMRTPAPPPTLAPPPSGTPRKTGPSAVAPELPDPDAIGLVPCPLFLDRASGKSATGGTVVAMHAVPGRSYVAGQRMLDVQTPIGVLPVRAKTNGFLVGFVVQPGAEVIEGKPLWRTRVSKPM